MGSVFRVKTRPSRNSECVVWKATQPSAALRVQVPIRERIAPHKNSGSSDCARRRTCAASPERRKALAIGFCLLKYLAGILATQLFPLLGDEGVHGEHRRLHGEDLLRENAVNFRISVEAGVLEHDAAIIEVKGAPQVERVMPLVEIPKNTRFSMLRARRIR